MKVTEKIRSMRKSKHWTQEEMAEKLNISANAYGAIERGETDVNLSRLEDISEVFEVDVSEFFDKKTNVFNNFGNVQTNQQLRCNIHQSLELLQIQHELEKQQLLNAEQSKEIALLKEIIELMKTNQNQCV